MAHKKAGGSSRNGRDKKGLKGRTFISVLPVAEAAE